MRRLSEERAGVAAGLGRTGGTSGLLEPGNELLDGELLGKSGGAGAGARGRGRGSSGRGSSSRGSGRSLAGSRGGLSSSGGSGSGRGGGSAGGSGRCGGGRRSVSGLGGGGRAGAGGGAVPDSGTGDRVLGLAGVDVEEDTGVGGRVGLGHVDTSAGEGGRAGAGDLDLTATVVELGTTLAVGLVESNDLRADQVVTSSEVGKGDGDLTLVGDEVLNSPLAVGETVLVELGPDGTLTVGVSRGNVDHDGTLVRGGDRLVSVTGGGGGVLLVVSVKSYVLNPIRNIRCGATGK